MQPSRVNNVRMLWIKNAKIQSVVFIPNLHKYNTFKKSFKL